MKIVIYLLLASIFFPSPLLASAVAINVNGKACKTVVYLAVPGSVVRPSSTTPPCNIPKTTLNGPHGSFATGRAIITGRRGASVHALAENGGSAGLNHPFLAPTQAGLGQGIAEIDVDAVRKNSTFTINGRSNYNSNGFLELSVLDLSEVDSSSQVTFASDIFSNYGSVESALDAGFIDPEWVLFREREYDLPTFGLFTRNINVGSIADDDILVAGLAHSVSVVPLPPTILLMGSALLGFVGLGFTNYRSLFSSH
jgi:hypothetical protein